MPSARKRLHLRHLPIPQHRLKVRNCLTRSWPTIYHNGIYEATNPPPPSQEKYLPSVTHQAKIDVGLENKRIEKKLVDLQKQYDVLAHKYAEIQEILLCKEDTDFIQVQRVDWERLLSQPDKVNDLSRMITDNQSPHMSSDENGIIKLQRSYDDLARKINDLHDKRTEDLNRVLSKADLLARNINELHQANKTVVDKLFYKPHMKTWPSK